MTETALSQQVLFTLTTTITFRLRNLSFDDSDINYHKSLKRIQYFESLECQVLFYGVINNSYFT